MIIFLYGADSYRSKQKLNEIVEHYKKTHKSGLNLRCFEGQDLDFQDFKNQLQTIPMFQEKKLLILSDVLSNKEFQEEFLKNSDKSINSNDVILFHEAKEISQEDSLAKFLKKHAKTQEFLALNGQQLKNWLKKEFAKYQVVVEPRALDKLLEFVGNNLWQLSNEVKKLSAFKKDKKVELKDIELLVKPKIDTDIFKTIDAIAFKNKKRALDLLHKHLEKGDSHLYLLTMISFQFRNLLLVKSGSKKLKMHPYVLKKTTSQAKAFSFEELKKTYRRLFEVDYSIKTGKLDLATALDLFISEV